MRDFGALHRFIAERGAMPFAWGPDQNDCVSFAAGGLLAMTGRSISFGGRRWTTGRGAAVILRQLGGMEAAVDSELQRVRMSFAQRGDVVAVQGKRGLLLGLLEGDTIAGPDLTGLQRLPRSMGLIAWSAE